MIELYSSKVGKRWFVITAFDEEATNPKPIANVEASYSVRDWMWNDPEKRSKKVWTLTGKGARKYRQQIIDHLEGKYFS